MSTKPAEKIGGYKLSRDDPTIFTEKNTFITCDRAFSDEEYPQGADSDIPVASAHSTTSQTPGVSNKQKQESRAMMVRMHTEFGEDGSKDGDS